MKRKNKDNKSDKKGKWRWNWCKPITSARSQIQL